MASSYKYTSLETRSEKYPEEGYDYELVGDPPSGDFTCLICHLVAREARQRTCCGSTFCRQCIERWMKVNCDCPSCGETAKFRHVVDKKVMRKINQLKVYCKNKKEGCTWEGQICDAEAHLDTCPYRQVQCPNHCTQAVRCMDVLQHLETQCPFRKVRCQHCKEGGKYDHINKDHLEDCPNLSIACPNEGCQKKPKRMDMEDHRQECPKETMSCEYAHLGCKHVCLREDIAKHNEENMETHLKLAVEELKILRTFFNNRSGASSGHVLKMTSFSKFKKKGERWCSPSFYVFPGGYKMCLGVIAGGFGDGKGTHISAYLHLMAGENDDSLEWPMRAKFTIKLLNQEKDQNHQQVIVLFNETNANASNSKVTKGCAECGRGCHKFIAHQDFERGKYLKDDALYFRVAMTKQLSRSKPWLAGAISH